MEDMADKKAIIQMIAKGDDVDFIRLIAKVATKRIGLEDSILEIPKELGLPQQ